jgi:hypothetical protein
LSTPELFGGKFNNVAKESSPLRRNAREMAQTMVQPQHFGKKKAASASRSLPGQFKRFHNLAPHEERYLSPPSPKVWQPHGAFVNKMRGNAKQKSRNQQSFCGSKGQWWGIWEFIGGAVGPMTFRFPVPPLRSHENVF